MKNEIIIYQSEELTTQIEVRVEDETVWLNRHQIATLFDRDFKTIGKHILNALKEELQNIAVVAKFATTATDGKVYQVEHYSIEVITSVGYRVKSNRGIQFRIWANKVLKNYLLKGYAINQRFEHLENDMQNIKQKLNEIDIKVNTSLPAKEGIFYDGQIFDAYVFATQLIKKAKKSIILIDNYIDESVLLMLAKRHLNVAANIFTKEISAQLQLDLKKHNQQYPKIEIKLFKKAHDRFLIIDNQVVYHVGASLKDLGKSLFAFSKMEMNAEELISKLNA